MASAKKVVVKTRKAKVAAGLVQGKSYTSLAKATNVSIETVRRDSRDPDTQALIADLVSKHVGNLRSLYARCLGAVDAALDAERPVHDGEGTTWTEDHAVRLAACREYCRLLTVGQGENPDRDRSRPGVTWEQFVVMYRSHGRS